MSLAQGMLDDLITACGVDHPKQQHFLLAVSGGKDSVVMAHLFAQTELSFGIAHCNFQLRGAAAEEDAQFVRALAAQFDCPFHLAVFDTLQVAEAASVSVQMAARTLRYDWLESLRKAEGYDYTVTAHHLTDAIETQLHHLVRGTGLKGLLGIPPRNGYVIRPLLFANRAAIEAYQEAQKLAFREDESNAETKYTRNYIRHQILPVLRTLNPSLEGTLGGNMQRLKESAYLMDQMVQQIEEEACVVQEGRVWYQLEVLRSYAPALSTLLFELLSPLGLNTTQANDLAQVILEGHSGRRFLTPTHEITTAAEVLEVLPLSGPEADHLIIESGEEQISFPGGQLSLRLLKEPPVTFAADPALAYFDTAALTFPLELRKWQAGDQFQPFGMGGSHQKLQDYFSNNKLTRAEKVGTWILTDAQGRIAWVVGHRSSHLHRVQSATKQCWEAKVQLG
ncbi:MAG: tRNA lysidine(34) synthetase TilS [Phaeodactylibacter sp.]|uniref:tRNA lysidine(34) synthetase TilS n=1 Tax=Phaeodactylibacter sp. TaxID=1940289 RepID=UPI0032EE7590